MSKQTGPHLNLARLASFTRQKKKEILHLLADKDKNQKLKILPNLSKHRNKVPPKR